MNIKKRVDSLVRKYKTRDPFELAEHMGYIIVYCRLEGIRGFYQYFQRNNIIYVDETLPRNVAMFVVAHELGHGLLHKNSNAIFLDSRTLLVRSKCECEANLFAMDLLLSDELLSEHLDYTTSQLARLYGCAEELVTLRLADFQIKEDCYEKMSQL